MGPAGDVRNTAAWKELRLRVIREETRCGLCGKPVDKTIPDRDPATGGQNPGAPTVDHKVPLKDGGAPLQRSNLRLAHRRCQNQQGATIANRRRSKRRTRRSRDRQTPRPERQPEQPAAPDYGHSRQW